MFFNEWLKVYIYRFENAHNYKSLTDKLSYLNSGQSFSRDEINER